MLYWLLVIIGAVGLDQLTKWLAVTCLKGGESFPLWEGVLHFTYVENTGAAFGSEHPVGGLKKLYWQDVLNIYKLVK
jgi:signal peptidase II